MRHRALVTGATGLVGSYVVERLLADGWSVRALVRDRAQAAWLEREGAELADGDVLDAPSFAAAARGCDAIFHTAAVITPRGGWEVYRATNVEGTRNAVHAAATSGARLLQLSSVAVYGTASRYGRGQTDERTPLPPLPLQAYYARSKRDSEAVALEAHRDGRIWAAAVRPDVIYGRRDRQFIPRVGRIFDRGVAPLIAGGRTTLAIVHAGNVADGAVRAVTHDAAGGQAFNLANDHDVTFADFVGYAAEGLERRISTVPVPLPVARLAFGLARYALGLVRGGGMRVAAEGMLDFLTRDNPFSSARARRELGWDPPVRPELGVPEAFRWWKAHRR